MARKSRKAKVTPVGSMEQKPSVTSPLEQKVCYRAGLYARLSEESEANRERATIETQMDLLRRFAAEQDDMVVVKEYFDISYSGTNFERPGFEEMIQDMRNGVINCIIVKDLSRLGRNYIETGNYIERVFPFFEVRFLAVTDSYVSRRHAVRTLLIFYLFLDMNGLVYHKEISRIWFEYGKVIFQSGWKAARKSLSMFDKYVENGMISLHHDNYSVTKYDQIPQWCVPLVAAFLELKSKENMTKGTIDNYLFSIIRLCLFIKRKGLVSFMELSPALLKEFNIYDKHGSSAGKNSCNLRIRKFLIYLAEKGAVNDRFLYQSLPSVAASKERIVTTLSEKELSEIRSSIKGATSPLELRDKAMLLLGLRMGLRASDIVNLKLSDINWKSQNIQFIQQKTKSELLLPMPVEVGNAVFSYLVMGRPETESRYIFLRSVAPYTKVGKSVCRDALFRALPEHSASGLGFHVTRRTFSTAMLNRGVSPQMIADALGHSGTDNLKKYLALDSERMKDCPLSLKDLGISMEGWTENNV